MHSRAAASVENKMDTMQHKIFAYIRGERETNSREFWAQPTQINP